MGRVMGRSRARPDDLRRSELGCYAGLTQGRLLAPGIDAISRRNEVDLYTKRQASALERRLESVHDAGVTPGAVLSRTGMDTLGGRPLDEPRPSPQAAREVRRNTAVRQARTCYDHLAGVAGVQLLEEVLRRGWLEPAGNEEGRRVSYRLTSLGDRAFDNRDIDLALRRQGRRRFAYGCLDWTERRFHLGGSLGAALLNALEMQGAVCRQPGGRAVTLWQRLTVWLDQEFRGYRR